MSHRRYFAAISLAISLTAWGCHGHNDAGSGGQSSAAQSPSQSPSVSFVSPQNGPQDDDSAFLARKTSQYARDIAPLLQDQQAPRANPTTVPSLVQWGEPLTPAQTPSATTPPDVTPPVQPVVAVSPKLPGNPTNPPAVVLANRPAHLSGIRTRDDIPEILPESADHLTDSSDAVTAAALLSSDEYERKLHQQVLDYPRDLANHLDYELLRFARDENTPDLASITTLTAEDREILSALLDGLSNFRNSVRADSNQTLSHKIEPLIEMADRLRSQGELTIPAIALCTRVDSFGVYKPVTSMRFGAGHDNEVIVYCEVANFTSIQDSDKMWQTRLKQEMTLYTDSGMAVWPETSNAQLFVDQARNRRHDFFIPRRVRLPSALTIGRYLLKVTITDPQSNRIAEATTPIEIVAE